MKIKDILNVVTSAVVLLSEVHYHLYSLPSFDDNQTREELLGYEIQSNKYNVPDKCILFNKLMCDLSEFGVLTMRTQTKFAPRNSSR